MDHLATSTFFVNEGGDIIRFPVTSLVIDQGPRTRETRKFGDFFDIFLNEFDKILHFVLGIIRLRHFFSIQVVIMLGIKVGADVVVIIIVLLVIFVLWVILCLLLIVLLRLHLGVLLKMILHLYI